MRYKSQSDIEKVLEKLGKIAKMYTCDDAETDALLLAAYALLFIQKSKLELPFDQYFEAQHAPLTNEQNEYLKQMGLEE